MDDLFYFKKGVFGKPESLRNLEKKESAELLLMSDSHGDYNTVAHILKNYGSRVDALLFSGDGISDFLNYITIARHDEALRHTLPEIICIVSGNGDFKKYSFNPSQGKSDSGSESFLEFPDTIFLSVSCKKILLTHGHGFFVEDSFSNILNFASVKNCDIVVFGHLHIPYNQKMANILFINPGSVSRPRMGSKKSFALLKLQKDKDAVVEYINY